MPKAFTTSEESPLCVASELAPFMGVTLYRRSHLVTVQDSTRLRDHRGEYGTPHTLWQDRRDGLRNGRSREGSVPRFAGSEQLPVLDQRARLIQGETRHQAIAAPVERRQCSVGERPVDDHDLVVRRSATDELDPPVVLV